MRKLKAMQSDADVARRALADWHDTWPDTWRKVAEQRLGMPSAGWEEVAHALGMNAGAAAAAFGKLRAALEE